MTINGEVKCKNSLSTTQNALPFFYCGNLTLFGWFDTKLGLFAAEQSCGTKIAMLESKQCTGTIC